MTPLTEVLPMWLDTVRPLTAKPLIVKLTPNCTSPAAVAAAGGGSPAWGEPALRTEAIPAVASS